MVVVKMMVVFIRCLLPKDSGTIVNLIIDVLYHSYVIRACVDVENRWVFSLNLEASLDFTYRIFDVSLFQIFGA